MSKSELPSAANSRTVDPSSATIATLFVTGRATTSLSPVGHHLGKVPVVTTRGSPPLTGKITTLKSGDPPRLAAIHRPSGDQAGVLASSATNCGCVPSTRIRHTDVRRVGETLS